jgi:hypothetical protein
MLFIVDNGVNYISKQLPIALALNLGTLSINKPSLKGMYLF